MSSNLSIPAVLQDALDRSDVRINGNRPWDIVVHNPKFFQRLLAHGSLGLGESYMDGWWDSSELDECIARLLRSQADQALPVTAEAVMEAVKYRFFNPQTQLGSKKVARQHYDLGNEWYESMLDPYMQYSCGYFKNTDNLATAQEQKLDLICRKLQLQKGMTLLDIGCGWGGLARFAAEHYGASVTGINISKEQIAYGREKTKGMNIEIRDCDYRKIEGTFDRIVSVGMFEHVGPKNYATYMKAVRKAVKPEGLALIHTIGRNHRTGGAEPWIEKYIFPNSILPTSQEVIKAAENHFVLEDWHNFGAYYDKTLMAWHKNAEAHWNEFKEQYGERFHRMWTYYLLSCAGSFRARTIQLWQLVLSPHGVAGGYESVR